MHARGAPRRSLHALASLQPLQQCVDETHEAVYYWHKESNTVSWELPTDTTQLNAPGAAAEETAAAKPVDSTAKTRSPSPEDTHTKAPREQEARRRQRSPPRPRPRGKPGVPLVNIRTQAAEREAIAQAVAPTSVFHSDSETASDGSLVGKKEGRRGTCDGHARPWRCWPRAGPW